MSDPSDSVVSGTVSDPRSSSQLGPVLPSERIELLDILRGFALIGVLYVNMHNFGAWEVTGRVHTVAYFFEGTVFSNKFFSLFSLLFGMGFAIQMRRASERGRPLFQFHWRRLVVLFGLGWAHALIYAGDIVRLYALLGFVLFLFRRWPPRRLAAMAIVLLVANSATWAIADLVLRDSPASTEVVQDIETAEPGDPSVVTQEDVYAARNRVFQEGSLSDVMLANVLWHDRWTSMILGYGPRALALFLLGMGILYAGIVHDVDGNRRAIRRFMWLMLCVGFPAELLTNYLWVMGIEVESRGVQNFGEVLGSFGDVALALAYASFISLQFSKPSWHRLFRPLAAVGRVPLSAYVGQSVVYTTIYYGYGLGQWGQLGPAQILPLAALIFALEVVVCNWWIRRFRFGPLEWLWRSATYLKWQPMRATPGV